MAKNNSSILGFWIHNNQLPSYDHHRHQDTQARKPSSSREDISHASSSVFTPLATRFQPDGCYKNLDPRCFGPFTDTKPFDQYHFQFAPPNQNLSLLRFVYRDIRLPHQFTPQVIQALMDQRRCTKFVVAIGQWAAGKRFRIHKGRGPTLFSQYFEQMKHALVDQIRPQAPNAEIYMRSINYNPMGAMIGGCKPTDWRSPAVIDGYNAVLDHLINHYQPQQDDGGGRAFIDGNHQRRRNNNMTYIDTNAIVGPMWDSASDWCHLDARVIRPQMVQILAVVLGMWKS